MNIHGAATQHGPRWRLIWLLSKTANMDCRLPAVLPPKTPYCTRFNPGTTSSPHAMFMGGPFGFLTRFGKSLASVSRRLMPTTWTKLKMRCSPNTRIVWLESPSNPLLTCIDIAAACDIAHAGRVKVVVDNTFATPILQQPLELGADIVMHSLTKYLGGHSDVVGGAVIVNDDEIHERLRFLQNATGGVPGPMDCFLVLRGTKTLAIRMRQHCENAMRIAEHLKSHAEVERVYSPGLPTIQLRNCPATIERFWRYGMAGVEATWSGTGVSLPEQDFLRWPKAWVASNR